MRTLRSDKVEELIRTFSRELEALVRQQLREEITRALEAFLAGQAPRPVRARRARTEVVPIEVPAAPAPVSAPPEAKRRGWTREAIVEELATWLLTGTVIEATFLTKHGKPGLVAAARKHFGRFDAALNAANVHLARLHPDGLPTTNRRMQKPS